MENLLSMGRLDVNVGAEKIQDQSHHPSRIKLVLCNCVSYPEHSALMSFYRSYRQLWEQLTTDGNNLITFVCKL